MLFNKYKIVVGITLLFAHHLFAQEVVLPFELSEDTKSIYLKLPVEDKKDSLKFFFDTGASIMLLDKVVANKHRLLPNAQKEISGAGGKKIYEMIINQSISLDHQHTIEGVNVVLEDFTALNRVSNTKFDGIIGATLLKKYITKVDIEENKMSFYKFTDSLDYTGYEKIEVNLDMGIPKFPIVFELLNGDKYEGDILFDSGAELTLLVNSPYKEKYNLLEKIDKKISYASTNLSNKTTYEDGLIKKIQLGNFVIDKKDLKISFSSDKEGVSSYEDLLGILGSEVIHRFNFILDYQKKVIYLKPNKLFNKDYEVLVNPVTLKYNETRTAILVENIIDTALLTKEGIQTGDEIISIDGVISNEIYIYRKMLQQEHKKVNIVFKNKKGKVKTIELVLKRLL